MKRFVISFLLMLATPLCLALQPFVVADGKLAGGSVQTAMVSVELKLAAAGLTVVGRYQPQGIASYGVVVATDQGLIDAAKAIGGTAVVVIPIRIGIKADGTVSYVNTEYWGRAYLRGDYSKAESALKAASKKLQTAFGAGKAFGGEVESDQLANYRYMWGMERFDDRSIIKEYKRFDDALKVVRDNLAKGAGGLSKVYELTYADKKMAVFGVAQNNRENGEGWWVNKINGAAHIAVLPWEVFIVDGNVMALHGRFRTALGWPSLSMGQFMAIGSHPDSTLRMMEDVAGVK
jgi:hypothetical protein